MPLYPPSSGGAPTSSQYVTLATDATLSAERVFTVGDGLEGSDAGAGSTYTLTARDFDNLLSNSGFEICQRVADPTSATTLTDGGYDHHDRWYGLRQGANATVTRVAGTDNSRFNSKLVAGGTTNRFGLAQVLKATLSIPMRGRTIRGQCRVRPTLNAGSGSMDVRIAVLEWTGTADSPTKDVVGDWTSSDYTVGAAKFFANTTLTLVGTATVAASHNTWTDLSITGTVSSSCNNLYLFVWTEDAPSHASDFLEVAKTGLYPGTASRTWAESLGDLRDCQHYCVSWISDATVTKITLGHGFGSSTTIAQIYIPLPVEMRAVPSLTVTAADWQVTDLTTDTDVTAIAIGTAGAGSKLVVVNATVASGLTNFRPYRLHADNTASRVFVLSAELGV